MVDPVRHAKALMKLDARIQTLRAQMVKLLKKAGPRKVSDYVFTGTDGKPLKLSQAFGKDRDLIVVHNMGRRCPYCTLWADNFNGVVAHLEARAAFLVTSPDDPKVQRAFRKERGWTIRMASTRGTTFAHDMGYEPQPGQHWPGFTTFRREKGGPIQRVASGMFGPGDDYCSVFHFFDLLADGIGTWEPQFRYRNQ